MAIFNENYIKDFFTKKKEINFITFEPNDTYKVGSELNANLYKNEPNNDKEAFIKHIGSSIKIQGNKLIIPNKQIAFYDSDKYLYDMIKVKAILDTKNNKYIECTVEKILDKNKSNRQYAKKFGFEIEFENSKADVDKESKIRKTEITKVLKIAKDTLKLTNAKFNYKLPAYVLSISDDDIQDFINCEEDYADIIKGSIISEDEYKELNNMPKDEYRKLINNRWEIEEFLMNTIKKNVKSDSSIRGNIEDDGDKTDFIIQYTLE